jgi:hypothetical protein
MFFLRQRWQNLTQIFPKWRAWSVTCISSCPTIRFISIQPSHCPSNEHVRATAPFTARRIEAKPWGCKCELGAVIAFYSNIWTTHPRYLNLPLPHFFGHLNLCSSRAKRRERNKKGGVRLHVHLWPLYRWNPVQRNQIEIVTWNFELSEEKNQVMILGLLWLQHP